MYGVAEVFRLGPRSANKDKNAGSIRKPKEMFKHKCGNIEAREMRN